MSDFRDDSTLVELIEGLLCERLDRDQHQRLQAHLRDDPAAQRVYLNYLDMHLALARLCRRDRAEVSPGPAPSLAGRSRSRWSRGKMLITVGVAAALALAATTAVRLWHRSGDAARGTIRLVDQRDASSSNDLATVVKLDGADWEPSVGPSPVEGEILGARRVRLRTGRATLAFLNGVMLTLEGPADLELVSIDRVFCHRGRLRVRVPAGAEGFVVAAPGSSVVDLGTEFAINVEDDGKARVMVFQGKAEAAVQGASGTAQRSHLVEERTAVEIDPRTGDITEATADTGSFLASPDLAPPVLDLDPDYPGAVLQARPWSYWRFETRFGDTTPNEISGGPPLAIVGAVDIAGGPAANGCAVLTASAVPQYLELAARWSPPRAPGYALELWLMAEEYNHSTIVALLAPIDNDAFGHITLLELLACGRYPFPPAPSVRFLHRWPPGAKGGVSVQNGIVYNLYRWHHLVAQGNGDRMELYMDGVLTRSQPLDPARSTAPCRVLLGRLLATNQKAPETYRPLVGRLDELALYDHPLSGEEVLRHYQLAIQKTGPR
jgi:hypothetical protein